MPGTGLGVAGGGGGAVVGSVGGMVGGGCVGAMVGGMAGRGVAVLAGAGVDEGAGFTVSAALGVGVAGIAVEVAVATGHEATVGGTASGDFTFGTGVGDETEAVTVPPVAVEMVREAVSLPGIAVGEPSAELFICVTPAATTSARTRARLSTPPIALLGAACLGSSLAARGVVIGAVLAGTRVVGSRARPHRAHASLPAFIGEWHRGHTLGESMKLQQPLSFGLRR
ncbi:MAG TPA: hypothetical protein VFH60_12030 [Chloroflexia bacterium]|nr:hypothetical protein [Chloroflexia bacterium]